MSHDKNQPKQVESEFVARASGEREASVASELENEDPATEEAAAIIEKLTIEEEGGDS